MKYQSLFNTWGYRSDVGDSANSFGKPRSCWDHHYPFCTFRNLTVSRLNCEARFGVQVTTRQHAIQERLPFTLQHTTTQLNICSKLWKLCLHCTCHIQSFELYLSIFMEYNTGTFKLNQEFGVILSDDYNEHYVEFQYSLQKTKFQTKFV
jgi:hypothetical protein